VRLSRLRWAVLYNLAKAWRLGLEVGIPAGRIVRVFNLNSSLTYRFLDELRSEGIAELARRGFWRLRGTSRAQALAEYVLESVHDSPYDYWASVVPEVYYYVAEPPSIEWLGYPEKTLVMVDEPLRDRINPPKDYRVAYMSLRGRRWRYDWDMRVARATTEQAVADLLSHDPDYPVEQYIFNHLDRIDLDDVARKTTPKGLRRLATFLAFLRTSTGREVPTSINYLSLADPRVLRERLPRHCQRYSPLDTRV